MHPLMSLQRSQALGQTEVRKEEGYTLGVFRTVEKSLRTRTKRDKFSWEPKSSGFSDPSLHGRTAAKRKVPGPDFYVSQSMKLLISNWFSLPLKANKKKMSQPSFSNIEKKKKKKIEKEKKISFGGFSTERVAFPLYR